MSDLRQISKKFLLEFIELYSSLPCLWKIKSREYSDRIKKDKAYEQLLAKLKEVDAVATKETVKKKIDSLRAGYRRELKKINVSKRSGAGSDDVYIPNLWYFGDLSFLSDQEITRPSVTNVEDNEDSDMNDNDNKSHEDEKESHMEEEIELLSPQSGLSLHESGPPTPSNRLEVATSTLCTITPRSRAKKAKVSCDDVLSTVSQRLHDEKVEDEFDVIGKNVACKLRKLSADTATITEKFIMDLLFAAQLGNITRHLKLDISQTVQQHPSTFTTLGPVQNNVPDGQELLQTGRFNTGNFFSHYNPDNSFI